MAPISTGWLSTTSIVRTQSASESSCFTVCRINRNGNQTFSLLSILRNANALLNNHQIERKEIERDWSSLHRLVVFYFLFIIKNTDSVQTKIVSIFCLLVDDEMVICRFAHPFLIDYCYRMDSLLVECYVQFVAKMKRKFSFASINLLFKSRLYSFLVTSFIVI